MSADSMIALAGGLGMFLLGIHHLMEGMKGFAGDSLRQALQKLVAGKWSGLVSGALFTALVQSSSAAVLTLIGFVSAGLISHTQAVAVVLGANLGTTATTWLVAVLGFKVEVSAAALPMIGLGGFLWLLAKGRVRAVGSVLAGFGLIFTGIDYMQDGMAGIQWNLEGMGDGPGWRILLALLGAVMTIVMQSSSAAAATTLVAMAAGSLTLDQAFAMVVGQNLGTTAKAGLAAIGGGLAVKRTVLAHVLFNGITGVLALVFLSQLGLVARWLGGLMDDDDGVLTLAAFHTLFNLAGIVIFFPWLGAFAKGIEQLTGRGEISAVARLGSALAHAGGPVAMEAAWRALVELTDTAFTSLKTRSQGRHPPPVELIAEIRKVADFVEKLRFESTDPQTLPDRRARIWHALDHLHRLAEVLLEPANHLMSAGLSEEIRNGIHALDAWQAWAAKEAPQDGETTVAALAAVSANFAAARKTHRADLLDQLGLGTVKPAEAMAALETLRWLDGAYYHVWRLADSLRRAAGDDGKESAAPL
jgi:phosphate:Na+ symporter